MIGTVITHAEVVAIVDQAAVEFGRLERENKQMRVELTEVIRLLGVATPSTAAQARLVAAKTFLR
jgi:hypothetical protein